MENEKKLLMKMIVEHRSHLENISNTIMNGERFPKLASRSEEVRKEGNDLFSQKDHDPETHIEIFNHYCKSISLAPLESEVLAQAYANRSAFLLHIQKYEDCIKDIDRTLKFTKSDVLTVKLLCRKVECLKKMGSLNYQSVLDAAENYAEKLDKEDKALVDKCIQKAKTCPFSNEKISKNQNNTLPHMDETLNCISIEHNEEYGRYLVARKNYNPGDFIFRDDLYMAVLNPDKNYTNCSYCLKVSWSGIACDYCSWAMFCNEECKKKAWDAFHDVECSIMPYFGESLQSNTMGLALRTLLVGISEAGSINALREELKMVDECPDVQYRGFYKNGKFRSCTIQSVYSLNSTGHSIQILEDLASDALLVLSAIVKSSQLIKNLSYKKIDDILSNEDLIFLGSLLIKFTAINMSNFYSFNQPTCYCNRLKSLDGTCCGRGYCIVPLASLINHSCNPNANIIFTEDKKAIVHALRPIEKNSQIYISYIGFYHDHHLNDRKKKLEKYDFTCKCRPCIEFWPATLISPESHATPPGVLEKHFFNDCKDVLAALDGEGFNINKNYSKKEVQKVCNTIVQLKRLPKATVLGAVMNQALATIYSRTYGWKPPIFAFGQCSQV